MVSTGPGRQGYRWRKLVARLREELPPVCWLCRGPIDRRLPAKHADSWTADHVIPLIEAPHLAMEPSNIRPAHRRCNSAKGDGRRRQGGPPPKASRHWG